MQKPIALFDFDGTLTAKDSFRALIRCRLAEEPFRIVPLCFGLPLYLLTAFLNWDKRWAKSWILWCLTFGQSPVASRERLVACAQVTAGSSSYWLPDILARIREHRSKGHQVVICTASSGFWVQPMLDKLGCDVDRVVGSELKFKWGGWVYASRNCYGAEKNRQLAPVLGSAPVVAAYSDHPSDVPMMNLAETAYVVAPKKKNVQRFERELTVPSQLLDGVGGQVVFGPGTTSQR